MKYLLLILPFILVGCNTASKQYDPTTGKKTEVISESASVMREAAKAHAECPDEDTNAARYVPVQTVALTPDQVLSLKADAQAEYIRQQMMLGMVNAMAAQTHAVAEALSPDEPDCHARVAASTQEYFKKEAAQANAWGKVGVTGLVAIPTAWVVSTGFKTIEEIASNTKSDITVRDINMQKSDDPTGSGGAGAGTGGDVPGSQNLNIGSGLLASDQGQAVNGGIDKNINTGFGNKSTSNQDQNRDPNRIDDGGDGANNDASLF